VFWRGKGRSADFRSTQKTEWKTLEEEKERGRVCTTILVLFRTEGLGSATQWGPVFAAGYGRGTEGRRGRDLDGDDAVVDDEVLLGLDEVHQHLDAALRRRRDLEGAVW